MAASNIPAGFKFRPTPHELLRFLHQRLHNLLPSSCPIIEEDLLSYPAQILPLLSALPDDSEWFFFHRLQRKSATRVLRKVKGGVGFWKSSGLDKPIKASVGMRRHTVGMRKSLVYHSGAPPRGVRTDWIIHEFSLCGEAQDYVVCRLFNKAASEDKDIPLSADPATMSFTSSRLAAAAAPTVPTPHQDAVPETLQELGASMEQVSSDSLVIQGHILPGFETLEVPGPEEVLSPGTGMLVAFDPSTQHPPSCLCQGCPLPLHADPHIEEWYGGAGLSQGQTWPESEHLDEQGADLSYAPYPVAAADAAAALGSADSEGGSTEMGAALLPGGESLGVSEAGVGTGGCANSLFADMCGDPSPLLKMDAGAVEGSLQCLDDIVESWLNDEGLLNEGGLELQEIAQFETAWEAGESMLQQLFSS